MHNSSSVSAGIPLDDASFFGISNLVQKRFGIHLTEKNARSFTADSIHLSVLSIWKASAIISPTLKAIIAVTGEEPFSLAMVLADAFRDSAVINRILILATDISMSALKTAKCGIYPAQKAVSIPRRFSSYFETLESNRIRVIDQIRDMVLFKRLNLMNDSFPFVHRFDLIFCRNVMIYFDNDTRNALLVKLRNAMHTGSHIIVGHSENLGRDTHLFEYIQPTIYTAV